MMGAYGFMQKYVRKGFIDDMFETIPYRDRPQDYLSPDFYFTEKDLPESAKAQLREAKKNDPDYNEDMEKTLNEV